MQSKLMPMSEQPGQNRGQSDEASDEASDEGLRWDEGGDPTHVDAREASETVQDFDARPRLSSPLLVLFGLIGGIFILYTVGWIIAVQRMTTVIASPFFEFMARVGEFLAIAAPAIWFIGVLYVTREKPSWIRVLALSLGVVLLIPVPFVLGIGATQ